MTDAGGRRRPRACSHIREACSARASSDGWRARDEWAIPSHRRATTWTSPCRPINSARRYSLVDDQSQAPEYPDPRFRPGYVCTNDRRTPHGCQRGLVARRRPVLFFRFNRSSTIGVELFMTSSSPGGSTRRIYGFEDVRAEVPSNLVPHYWSRDGQVLFSQATMGAGYGIWSTSIEGKNPRAIVDTPHNELQAAVSPDGRWMACTRRTSRAATRSTCVRWRTARKAGWCRPAVACSLGGEATAASCITYARTACSCR